MRSGVSLHWHKPINGPETQWIQIDEGGEITANMFHQLLGEALGSDEKIEHVTNRILSKMNEKDVNVFKLKQFIIDEIKSIPKLQVKLTQWK